MTLGFDLLLTQDHDLDFSANGDLTLVADVAQAIKIKLLFLRGEWFLDLDAGLPYFEQIFIKRPHIDRLRALYRTAILSVPGVRELRNFDLDLDAATRRLTLRFSADTDEGEIDDEIVVG